MDLIYLHLPVCVTQHSGMTPMPANYPLYGGPPYGAHAYPGASLPMPNQFGSQYGSYVPNNPYVGPAGPVVVG